MKTILISLLFALSATCLGQFVAYAPDLKWDSETHTYVGFANPTRATANVTLRGYTAAGELIGERVVALTKFSRFEEPSKDIFGLDRFNESSLAWLRLESDLEVGGYVRYEGADQKSMSLVVLNNIAGREVYVPHITKDPQFYSEVVGVNLGQEVTEVLSQPYIVNPNDRATNKFVLSDEPLVVGALDTPLVQDKIDYQNFYPGPISGILWDRLYSNEELAASAMQHFGSIKSIANQRASMNLPRSPFHEVVFSHINKDRENFWTCMVLINTFNGILPVEIQSYLEDGTPFQNEHFEMQPYEKKVFFINNTNPLGLSDVAAWFRVTSAERGLIGYEIFGSPDQRVMAGLEPAPTATSMCVLPYTPTSDRMWSGIGFLNTFHEDVSAQVGGFDDEGNLIGVYDCVHLAPNQKATYSMEYLFGERASEVTWARVDVERGTISAYSFSGDRERNVLGAAQGIPVLDLDGLIFLASFEHDKLQYLHDQGWTEYRFNSEYEPADTGFYLERYYEPKDGVHHLGYTVEKYTLASHPNLESVALVSPFFEIPNDDNDVYINFNIRLVDSEDRRPDGRYGIVWREEGSSTWNWHGLTAETLDIDPYGTYAKPYNNELKHWRHDVHWMTRWWPFSLKLPDHLRGKRIQVGPYYHQTVTTNPDTCIREDSPTVFYDQIFVSPKPLSYYRWDPNGFGQFIFVP